MTKRVLYSIGLFKFLKREPEEMDKKLVYSLSDRKIPSGEQIKHLKKFLSPREHLVVKICTILILVNAIYLGTLFIKKHLEYIPMAGGEYIEGVVGYPKTINPLYASSRDIDHDLSRLIYSSLFLYNSNGELTKDLVNDFKIEAEGKEYIIQIRDNVEWHNNEKLTIDDVIFTFNLIKDQEYNSPLRHSLLGVKAEKIDNQTVKFTLNEAYAPFPELLTFGIVPKSIWENVNSASAILSELNLKPIGSGPYKFKSLLKNKNGYLKEYRLVVNDKYYNKKPYLTNIVFKFFVSYPEAIKALNDNQIDGLNYLPPNLKEQLLAKNSLFFHELNQSQIVSIFFNSTKQEKLADKETRQALDSAINKEQIIEDVYRGVYRQARGPILENNFAYNDQLPQRDYNPSEASNILKGKALELTLTVVDVNGNVAVAEKIKYYWEQAGVNVTINVVSSNQASGIIKDRNFEALMYGQTVGGDPDVYVFWHSSQANAKGLNLASYNNPDVDKLLVEARAETDPGVRINKYKQFQEKVVADSPVIFLYSPTYTYLQSKKVKGFAGTVIIDSADRFGNISDWYKKTKKKFVW